MEIEVTQADRDAANRYRHEVTKRAFNGDKQRWAEYLDEAFAAHRQAALIEGARLRIEAAAGEGMRTVLAASLSKYVFDAIRALEPEAVVKATPPA